MGVTGEMKVTFSRCSHGLDNMTYIKVVLDSAQF